MGKTTKFQLPYPEDSDVANVPLDMKKLAEKAEEILEEHEQGIEDANNKPTGIVNSKDIADKTKNTYSAEIIDGIIEENNKITIVSWSDIFTIADGFHVLEDSTIFKDRNRYFGTITVAKNNGVAFNSDGETVLRFKKNMLGIQNTGCFLTNNQWNTQSVGYCYIAREVIIVSDLTVTKNIAKIALDIVLEE